jgi:hypothetical protein
VAAYFAQFAGTADDFLRLASDFHFLLFLAVNGPRKFSLFLFYKLYIFCLFVLKSRNLNNN